MQKRAELGQIALPDRSLERLPAGLEKLVTNSNYEQVLEEELIKAIRQQLPRLRHDCQRLATSQYRLALDHGDLHAGNILDNNGAITLIDWGDSALTHPFTCLVATFEAFFDDVIAAEDEPAAQRLRDIYLEQFPEGSSLRTEFREVIIIGDIVRTLVMDRILQSVSSQYVIRWGPFMAKWLTRWLKNFSKS
jgi:23S rRNA G2069 N7-methylase RlmK/C1962 C5-methylase RlmI